MSQPNANLGEAMGPHRGDVEGISKMTERDDSQ